MSDMTPEMRELKEALRAMEGPDGSIDGGLFCEETARLYSAARAFLPKPRRHTFGGVVFEETGEYRQARRGEWIKARMNEGPSLWMDANDSKGKHDILRPVSVEGVK